MLTLGSWTTGSALVAHAIRRMLVAYVRPTILVAAMAIGYGNVASAQETPRPHKLRIAVSDTGRAVFDGLIPDIAATSRLGTEPELKHTTALGALRDFCRGIGESSPDIVLTTRRLSSSLIAECEKNGVEHIAQIELGRTALVLAVRSGSPLTSLSARQVYLALARDVPDKDEFRRNTAIRWSDIERSLPALDIRFQVPPREDPGRSLFNALILEGGCREEPQVKLIFSAEQRIAKCMMTRVDRVREIPRNQAVRALLDAPEGTVGVVSHIDIERSDGKLVGISVDGIAPDHDSIVKGTYEYSYMYFLYAKRGQALHGGAPALDVAVDRVISRALTEPVVGPGGILSNLGLLPLSDEDRAAQRHVFTIQPSSYDLSSIASWVSSAATAVRSLVNFGLGRENAKDADDAMDFTKLMDLAGYKTQEFQTSLNIIPSASMIFGIVREMSESDQEHLERELEQDARVRVGTVPALQRKIVRSILDVSEAAGYELSRVEIEILPLPSVKLVMGPTDPPISIETTLILRSIERMKDRMSEMSQ